MRWIGLFLVAGAIIAAGQAVAIILCLLILIGLVVTLFERPRELFGMIGLCVVGALMQAQPLAFIALVALMVIANLLHQR